MTAYSCETQCLLLLFLVSVRRRHNIRKLSYSFLDIVFCLSLHSLKFYYKKRFKKIIHLCFGTTHNDILRTLTKVRSDVPAKKAAIYNRPTDLQHCSNDCRCAMGTNSTVSQGAGQFRHMLCRTDTLCGVTKHCVEYRHIM